MTTNPSGWVTAPREPTHEMIDAGANVGVVQGDLFNLARATYRAMIAAAPPPPTAMRELSDEDVERAVKAYREALAAYRKSKDAELPHHLQAGKGGAVLYAAGEEVAAMRAALAAVPSPVPSEGLEPLIAAWKEAKSLALNGDFENIFDVGDRLVQALEARR